MFVRHVTVASRVFCATVSCNTELLGVHIMLFSVGLLVTHSLMAIGLTTMTDVKC
jgi:hypothetical protein